MSVTEDWIQRAHMLDATEEEFDLFDDNRVQRWVQFK
jgi:hypothetical protein